MKQKNNINSNEENLDIYSKKPMNKREYLKNISKVKSKYMQDYKNSIKASKYTEEKNFNNILKTYFQDYNKLKNKYNFKKEAEPKKPKYDFDEINFKNKQRNLNGIISGDLNDIQEFNFDMCDNLINDLPKENNNYSLMKTIQNKEDYELRLQGFNKINNDVIQVEGNIGNEDEENKENNSSSLKGKKDDTKNDISQKKEIPVKKESFRYIEDDMQFKDDNDNYLILNQQNNLNDELPLFNDIISTNFNKEYQVPFYEHKQNEKNEEKDKEEKNEEEEEKEEEEKEIEEEIDINRLVLVNKNKKKYKFDDIISNYFDKKYIIPEYKIPNKIKEEIEQEKIEQENKKIINEENLISSSNNENNNQKVDDMIKYNDDDFVDIDEIENKKKEEENPKPEKNDKNLNKNANDEEGDFEEINVDELKDDDDNNNNYNDFEK